MAVHYELSDRVATITFDDGKANAIDAAVLGDLHSALDGAGRDGAGAVVLAGRPGRFSAGFNLADMTASHASMKALVAGGARLTARLLLEPRPVVAACTGHALAAGALLLLGADRRVGAAGEWKIGLNEVAIGMALPRWAVELALHRLAPTEFAARVVLGQVADPAGAVAAGFLDRVVPPERVVEEARAEAATLARLHSRAVEGTKERARGQLVQRMLEGLEEDLDSLGVPRPA